MDCFHEAFKILKEQCKIIRVIKIKDDNDFYPEA
jgi:hypothetical protein